MLVTRRGSLGYFADRYGFEVRTPAGRAGAPVIDVAIDRLPSDRSYFTFMVDVQGAVLDALLREPG